MNFLLLFLVAVVFFISTFIPLASRLCNPLPAESFPVPYDFKGFKASVDKNLCLHVIPFL